MLLKAFKYRIYPTEAQKESLDNFFGSVRFVYNLALETKIQAWVSARKSLNCIQLSYQLKDLKDSDAKWLKFCPAQSLQMTLRNLDNAYTRFYKGGGFPKFKSKKCKQSVHFPQGVKADFKNGTIFLPKLKNVSCLFHRKFNGKIKTVTASKTTTGKYYVSILVDDPMELPKKNPIQDDTAVGIDLGIKSFATLSDGSVFENQKHLRSNLSRLRVEQRKLDRRFKKGTKEQSKGYQRQRLVVSKIHEKIKSQREDYLQKVSAFIIANYDTICLEDLNIQGMMKNRKLSRAIGEIGWHKFKTMLEYKAEWYGKNILYIGLFEPSSKICSTCGTINKELKLSDRIWTCKCGEIHDRDINAAKNIKTFGLRNQPSTVNVDH